MAELYICTMSTWQGASGVFLFCLILDVRHILWTTGYLLQIAIGHSTPCKWPSICILGLCHSTILRTLGACEPVYYFLLICYMYTYNLLLTIFWSFLPYSHSPNSPDEVNGRSKHVGNSTYTIWAIQGFDLQGKVPDRVALFGAGAPWLGYREWQFTTRVSLHCHSLHTLRSPPLGKFTFEPHRGQYTGCYAHTLIISTKRAVLVYFRITNKSWFLLLFPICSKPKGHTAR